MQGDDTRATENPDGAGTGPIDPAAAIGQADDGMHATPPAADEAVASATRPRPIGGAETIASTAPQGASDEEMDEAR